MGTNRKANSNFIDTLFVAVTDKRDEPTDVKRLRVWFHDKSVIERVHQTVCEMCMHTTFTWLLIKRPEKKNWADKMKNVLKRSYIDYHINSKISYRATINFNYK